MTTQSIDFHERCLKNRVDSLTRMRQELDRLQSEIIRSVEIINFTTEQIAEAKYQGKKQYDPERFMAKDNPLNKE